MHLPVVGLDLGEELDAVAELAVGTDHRDQQHDRGVIVSPGRRSASLHRAHVEPAFARAFVMRDGRSAAEQRAERRREEQRHRERRRERRDQRDRHVFHELADHAGPEQQRREGGDARRGRRDHRAGHARGGQRIGLARRHALRHPPLGEFGDDDRVVDQHADREDQREQHDDVHREPGKLQPEHAGKERRRESRCR